MNEDDGAAVMEECDVSEMVFLWNTLIDQDSRPADATVRNLVYRLSA